MAIADTEKGRLDNGVKQVTASTWRAFVSFVTSTFLDFPNYVYRGQCAATWALTPSLDRMLSRREKLHDEKARLTHLETFQYAIRGRRGPNPSRITEENEWWALGQHHGLATPLLDWTISPYTAAFFAFAPHDNESDTHRAVFALSRAAVNRKNRDLRKLHGDADAGTLEIFRPLSDDNPRLVNQGGVLTRAPDGVTVESWVQSHFVQHDKCVLYRIRIPTTERTSFLRNLNRMNINHLTLFPDLYGAAKFANSALEIVKY